MAGVHGLQHVERLLASGLTHHDAIGPHPERVDQQLPLLHGTLPLDVRRTRLQAGDVLLMQLELCGVFDRDDAVALGDEAR